jgi:enamine deaminase RidA (YjgF/YER057c/UK114 family)
MSGGELRAIAPAGWPPARGYAHGISAPAGDLVFVAGQIGWTADGRWETDDFIGQCRQALQNTVAVLAAAGAGPEHVARMTWYVTDKREYLSRLPELGRCYREIMGRHFPTMTLVQVAALLEDRARVEIETTAVIPAPRG